MRFLSRAATTAVVMAVFAVSAHAGQVRLQIKDGRITLQATDATPREILAEWARVGQTKVVNGDRVAGGPLTIELTNVPERQALDIVLRAAAGFVAAPRTVPVANTSIYDRILVMPGVRPAPGIAAPAASTATRGGPGAFPGSARNPGNMVIQQQPVNMTEDMDEPVVQPQMPMPVAPGASQPGMPTQSPNPSQPPYPTQSAPFSSPYGSPQQMAPAAPGTTPGASAARPGMPTGATKPPGGPGGN